MRRLIKWAAVTAAVAAVVRWLRRRGRLDSETADEPDHAEDLRRKLAETRDSEAADEEPVTPPEATVEERRADVHGQGREALDEMGRPRES